MPRGKKDCPECCREPAASAQVCDCGYNFITKNFNYTTEQVEELARFLDKHGYTDHTDASASISLADYGLVRNPTTEHTVFARPVGENDEFGLDCIEISLGDVLEALDEASEGFFSFIGSTVKIEREGVVNNDMFLCHIISSLNAYNGRFDDHCDWTASMKSIKETASN